jgi:hypothetical protein
MHTGTQVSAFCRRCGKRQVADNRRFCEPCLQAAREWEAKKKAAIPAGICRMCGRNESPAGFRQCQTCRQKQAENMRTFRVRHGESQRHYMREWNAKRRDLVIAQYGGQCACCGESQREFLAVDHINGGGDEHRRQVRSGGSNMIDWLINHDFPSGFQILCHNCNQARGYYGRCPHQRDEEA